MASDSENNLVDYLCGANLLSSIPTYMLAVDENDDELLHIFHLPNELLSYLNSLHFYLQKFTKRMLLYSVEMNCTCV